MTKALEKMEAAGAPAGGGREGLRGLRMTLWMGHRAAADEQAAAEFARRVADIRSGDELHGWHPF